MSNPNGPVPPPSPPPFVFKQIDASEVCLTISDPVDKKALEQATVIVNGIKDADDRSKALLDVAKKFGDMTADMESYIVPKHDLKAAYDGLPQEHRTALDRIHGRVSTFAKGELTRHKTYTTYATYTTYTHTFKHYPNPQPHTNTHTHTRTQPNATPSLTCRSPSRAASPATKSRPAPPPAATPRAAATRSPPPSS